MLKVATGEAIAVEVTRQTLAARIRNIEVYAIRDLRERHATAERLARQGELLLRQEEDLEAQNARFEMTVNNMAQGVCLFGPDQRVVIANRRYAEIYGLTAEQVQRGTTLRQILEARAATGVYGDADAENVRGGRPELRRKGIRGHSAAGWAGHFRGAPADGGRRPDQHARGHHRARGAERTPRQAARAARCGAGEHAAGPRHVRCRAAPHRMQPALRRHVRPDGRAGEARHDRSPDPAISHRQRLLPRPRRRELSSTAGPASSARSHRASRSWPTAASSA